jgi:hypothetical protein
VPWFVRALREADLIRPDTGAPPWWTTVPAMLRSPLKNRVRTLIDIINSLNVYQANGFGAVEVFAPCAGGTC